MYFHTFINDIKIFEKVRHSSFLFFGGAYRDRTGDPLLAKQMLSQLSYTPLSGRTIWQVTAILARSQQPLNQILVGVPELESGTSSLSATRSNQLSYTPELRQC